MIIGRYLGSQNSHETVRFERSPTVLVIDDPRRRAGTLALAPSLEDRYTVRTAHTREEALGQLDEAVDAVVLDRVVSGLSGTTVRNAIHDRGLACGVVVVTPLSPADDGDAPDAAEYLVRPVETADLDRAVRAVLLRGTDDRRGVRPAATAAPDAVEASQG